MEDEIKKDEEEKQEEEISEIEKANKVVTEMRAERENLIIERRRFEKAQADSLISGRSIQTKPLIRTEEDVYTEETKKTFEGMGFSPL